jgi:hypothetical protein
MPDLAFFWPKLWVKELSAATAVVEVEVGVHV